MGFHVIGDADTVLGFRLAGASGAVVTDAEQARAAFRDAIAPASGHQVLVLTEPVAAWLDVEVAAHRALVRPPYMVEVPDLAGTPVTRQSLESVIREAVGIHMDSGPDTAST